MVRKIPKLTQFLLTCCGFTLHCTDGWNIEPALGLGSVDCGLARSVCPSDDIKEDKISVLPSIMSFNTQEYYLDIRFLGIIFSFCRTGTAPGTQPTQTWPSVFRTQCWFGSPVSISGCWPLSTAFTSTAMTMDAFKCLPSALPRWWDFMQNSSQIFTQWQQTLKKNVFPNKIPISPSRTFPSCSGAGLPARILRLCGVLLHPAGEEPGDPAAHGLPTQPHHTQYDCGKYRGSTLIVHSCLPLLTLFFRCKCLEPSS